MKKKNKKYIIGDTFSLRLTQKAGVDQEILDWLNKHPTASHEIIKAIKFWLRVEGKDVDRVREAIEKESIYMNENEGKYSKKTEIKEEVEKELAVTRTKEIKTNEIDDELFGDKEQGKRNNALMTAISSISRHKRN